jgi:hypothetical protein
MLAMGWDTDSIEEALLFAASIREEALSTKRAWASGVAEGALEPFATNGEGILGWGEALLAAVSLAETAQAGEVLVAGEIPALRAGQLSVVGPRVPVTARPGVYGWQLDLEHPWQRSQASGGAVKRIVDTPEPQSVEIDVSVDSGSDLPPLLEPHRDGELAAHIRKLARAGAGSTPVDGLGELRRARVRAEGGPPSARCQASLALAMMLSIAGRPEEALLEALDALARAREALDPKAVGACMALLAKLYAGAGFSNAATALRESVTGGQSST